MNACPPALAGYAEVLLAGTGLTPDSAARAAADPTAPVPADASAAAAALRDGWAAASVTRDTP